MDLSGACVRARVSGSVLDGQIAPVQEVDLVRGEPGQGIDVVGVEPSTQGLCGEDGAVVFAMPTWIEPAGLDEDVVVLVEAVDGEHGPAPLAGEAGELDRVGHDGGEAIGALVHGLPHLAPRGGGDAVLLEGREMEEVPEDEQHTTIFEHEIQRATDHGTSFWWVETRD